MKKMIRLVFAGQNMSPKYMDIENVIGKKPISEAKKILREKYPDALFCLIGKKLNVPIILDLEGQNIGKKEAEEKFDIHMKYKFMFVSPKGCVMHNNPRFIS